MPGSLSLGPKDRIQPSRVWRVGAGVSSPGRPAVHPGSQARVHSVAVSPCSVWIFDGKCARTPERQPAHKGDRMAVQFMNRVYGEPMLHNPALCGDLSSRQAKWWTNLFTTEFYLAHEHLFHSGPYASLTQVVAGAHGRTVAATGVQQHQDGDGGAEPTR